MTYKCFNCYVEEKPIVDCKSCNAWKVEEKWTDYCKRCACPVDQPGGCSDCWTEEEE